MVITLSGINAVSTELLKRRDSMSEFCHSIFVTSKALGCLNPNSFEGLKENVLRRYIPSRSQRMDL